MGTPCKCCKSDEGVNAGRPARYFQDAVKGFQERHGNMLRHQEILKTRIDAMEKSIPAFMAYNMWRSGQKCADAPLCKIKQIMDKLSPTPDPTEKLLANLKTAVSALNEETEKLHGEIIDKEIELEERGMELDSLESENQALEERVADLEKEVKKSTVPSLHSIHSDDLVCLTKIRELGAEEVNLKCTIKELEEKELNFRQQMEQLLTSPEFQNDSGGKKLIKRIKELEAVERQMNCALRTHEYNAQQSRKINEEQMIPRSDVPSKRSWLPKWILPNSNDQENPSTSSKKVDQTCSCAASLAITSLDGGLKRCLCPTPAPVSCCDKPPCRAEVEKLKLHRTPCKQISVVCPSSKRYHSACVPLPACCLTSPRAPVSRRRVTHPCLPEPRKSLCVIASCDPASGSRNLSSCRPPGSCESSPRRNPPPCAPLSRNVSPSRRLTPLARCNDNPLCRPPECLESFGLPKSTLSSTPCKECLPPRKSGGCRCSCKGRCARGKSDVPCNCSVAPICSSDKGYQPKGLPDPPCGKRTGCWLEEDSEEEICGCCECGCNESDDS